MFTRLSLTAVLLVTVIPSFGVAGVMIDTFEYSRSNGLGASSSIEEIPEADYSQRLGDAQKTFGLSSSFSPDSVLSAASATEPMAHLCSIAILELTHSLSEWIFVPASPSIDLLKVPID